MPELMNSTTKDAMTSVTTGERLPRRPDGLTEASPPQSGVQPTGETKVKQKVIIYGDTPADRQFAMRAAEHLLSFPEKRDVIMVYGDKAEVYAHRTKTGTISAVVGSSPTTGTSSFSRD